MYLDTMQQIFSSTNKLLVDTHNSSQLLYLPLDHLLQQGTAGETATHGPAATAPAPPTSVGPAESTATPEHGRDTTRSREREGR